MEYGTRAHLLSSFQDAASGRDKDCHINPGSAVSADFAPDEYGEQQLPTA
jgi:hypothetical protein